MKVADSSEETYSGKVDNDSSNNTDTISQENPSKKESEKNAEVPVIELDPPPNIFANSAPTAKSTESIQLEVKEKSSEDISWALDDIFLEIMGAELAADKP